jgi:hypothetical protein
MTLYASEVFPPSIVTSSGFVFPEGQLTISYQGITVTKEQGIRKYGSPMLGRSETGNLGYATVTFGDSAGMLTTQEMPIFFYYQITDSFTGDSIPVPVQRGWFGHLDAGTFLFAGPKKSSLGGVILVKSIPKSELQRLLAEDSYVQADVVDYQIVDFDCKLAAQGLNILTCA